ncbi:MAG: alpha/beta hydrolase [Cyanobacteria bacterium P01_A01_bin.84]
MSTDLLSTSTEIDIGGTVGEFEWDWKNQPIKVVYECLGSGSPLLLLPAFSTVSMRSEMAGIAKLLAPYFQTVAVDFPGFGESSRLGIEYNRALFGQFLKDFVTSVFNTPISVISAGHSCPYVLQLAQEQPSLFSRIALIAPTWRGPLPTMGANKSIAGMVKNLVRTPIIGQILYKLNTTPGFLSLMYRRHVYTDVEKLTPDFIDYKWHNTQQPGARFAPAAFVTGNLDAVDSRDEFLDFARDLSVPLMVAIAQSSPPKSLAEMEAIAALPGVKSVKLSGSLGIHEEYPQIMVEAILPFLNG